MLSLRCSPLWEVVLFLIRGLSARRFTIITFFLFLFVIVIFLILFSFFLVFFFLCLSFFLLQYLHLLWWDKFKMLMIKS